MTELVVSELVERRYQDRDGREIRVRREEIIPALEVTAPPGRPPSSKNVSTTSSITSTGFNSFWRMSWLL